MNSKEKYISAEMEIMEFDSDVIVTSDGFDDGLELPGQELE